jgi:hypothetical protein
LTIVSLDGLCFDILYSDDKKKASLMYASGNCNNAMLVGEEIFDLYQLNQHTWVTVFRDHEIEKLVVSIKLGINHVFSIKSFYGRNTYYIKDVGNSGHYILTDENKSIIAEINLPESGDDTRQVFEIKVKSNYNLESDWFLTLHAVHCVLYLKRHSDQSGIGSFSH